MCGASFLWCWRSSNPIPNPPPSLQGPVHTALTVVREEGLPKLWSGGTATTIRQGSNQMSLFWGKAVADGWLWDKQVRAAACGVMVLLLL